MAPCEHCSGEHDDKLKVCPATGHLFAIDRFFHKDTVLDGKYRLDRMVRVSETAVFTATHTLLNKKVAVKILFPEADLQETTRQMIKEARAVSATGHPNIVAITDLGLSPEGALFIVMEYVQGPTLAEVIQRKAPLPISRAAWIVSEILAGLAAVARKGITHQDVKPSNVMIIEDDLGEDAIKIMDFCVGRVTQADLSSTRARSPRQGKTLTYLSPEQLRSRDDVDRRADIYACGAILYHLLTGHPPFFADDQVDLIASILEGETAEPSSLLPSIPREMDRVVMRALHCDRAQRFSSAAEFRDALEPFLSRDSDDELEWSPPQGEELPRRQITLDLAPDPQKLEVKPAKPTPARSERTEQKPARKAAAARKKQASASGLEATMDVDVQRINAGRSARGTPKTGKVKKVDTGITAPPKAKKREPLASQEIFQGLGDDAPPPDTAADPFAPPLDAGDEPSIDLDSLNMVPLDDMDGPGEPVVDDPHDMELDLEPSGAEEPAFLSAPEPEPQGRKRDDADPFAPRPDAETPMSMLDVADDPFHGSRATGREERVTGPHGAVTRPSGSAAFEGEQEGEFHRAAIQVLLVALLLGAVVAVWPDRYRLWSAVTGDYSTLKMMHLTTEPKDAAVYLNGRLAKARPIRFPGDLKSVDLRVSASGYVTAKKTVKVDVKGPLKIVLKKR